MYLGQNRETSLAVCMNALHISEDNFRSVMENIQDVFYRTNLNGEIIMASSSALGMFGYDSLDEILGKPIENFWMHPEERSAMLDLLRRYGKVADYEVIIRRKNGSPLFVSTSSSFFRDSDGNIIGVGGIIRDISERKKLEVIRAETEEALRKSEEKYRNIFDNAIEGIYQTTPNGRYHSVNPAFAKMFGYSSPDEMISSVTDIGRQLYVDPKDRERLVRIITEQDFVHDFETRVRRKDGSIFWISINAKAIRDRRGKLLFLQGTNVDITERKRAEEDKKLLQAQLLQAQKMESVGRLAGGIAHDFNNMLTVILGHTEIAMEHVAYQDPIRDDLVEIRKTAQRAADITSQLLIFARKKKSHPISLDINIAVMNIRNMLKRLIGEQIEIAVALSEQLWNVRMDPSNLDQILTNLTINARDAISGSGVITMETSNIRLDDDYCNVYSDFRPGEYVMLSVGDNGSGMNKEVMSHLFEPFYTTKEAGKGTGLGLSTVYGIVKQNGGFINVFSEPGRGTLFNLYLPRDIDIMPASCSHNADHKSFTGTETILLVEDEISIIPLVKKMLCHFGYRVLSANSHQNAIEIASEYDGDIHLLLSDVSMPGMSSGELRKRIEAIRPGIKTLLMSSYSINAIIYGYAMDDNKHFIQKPFTAMVIAKMIRETLDARELERNVDDNVL